MSHLVYQREVTHEELLVEEELKQICAENNIKTVEVWGATLYHLQVYTYAPHTPFLFAGRSFIILNAFNLPFWA